MVLCRTTKPFEKHYYSVATQLERGTAPWPDAGHSGLFLKGAICQADQQEAESQRVDRGEAGGQERLLLLQTPGAQTGV